ncbi:MAG TPA: hypothetical protein VMF07_20390 [Solirubrobacteraceae bacterium]|nr:hypothetical protein [Solirubrobacteraceae bacterium]
MRSGFKPSARRVLAGATGLLAAGGTMAVLSVSAHGASAPSEKVSTTGNDAGNCVKAACATINYAIEQATPGEVIHVAAGTYNQTVDVNKAVRLVGAGTGAKGTILDGTNQDPSSQGYFGIVYVGNAGGAVTVSGFTIQNPAEYATTGGEPMAVVLEDSNASDQISIINDNITESTGGDTGSDFPIGIDTFVNAAQTTISGDKISNFFQGALLEDNGSATVTGNTFSGLIASGGYPAEGLFFLADEGGNYTGQNASSNTFTGYSGDGIAEAAGYTGGYVTAGCVANGSIGTSLTGNTFALTGGAAGTGIVLESNGTGNNLTGAVNGNKGYVTSPSSAIEVESNATPASAAGQDCSPYSNSNGGGGTTDVTENNDNITVKAAAGATATRATAMAGRKVGALHVPQFRKQS